MKTVWVLGAGASHSVSDKKIPLLNGLPKFAFERGIYRNHSDDHEFGLLKEFVQENVGKNLARGASVDFEQCLTNLEISYSRTRESKYRSAIESLTKLIKEIILAAETDVSGLGEYEHLRLAINQKEDSILTFNWDTLLDQVLGHKHASWMDIYKRAVRSYQNFLVGYSTGGAKVWQGLPGQAEIGKPSEGIYLKLHGSINWFTCPTKDCNNHRLVHVTRPDDAELTCTECGAIVKPLIVPPTLNKNIDTSPLINKIWGRARNEISSAERIIIWGYSLPPTDFYSDWLLRQAGASLQELILINPSASETRDGKPMLSSKYLKKFEKLQNLLQKQTGSIRGYACYSDYQHDQNRLIPFSEVDEQT